MDLETAEVAVALAEILLAAREEIVREVTASSSGVAGVPSETWGRIVMAAGRLALGFAGKRVTLSLSVGSGVVEIHWDATPGSGAAGATLVRSIDMILAPRVFS